mgnify:CR=1 FL=1
MNNAAIINALPANTVIAYDWRGDRYFWTKAADGRFVGTYFVNGTRCANGILNAAGIARYIDADANTNVSIN